MRERERERERVSVCKRGREGVRDREGEGCVFVCVVW